MRIKVVALHHLEKLMKLKFILCGEICPFGLPAMNISGKYEIKIPEHCTECSACQRNCPTQAIVMQERKGCGCLWDARKRLNGKNNSVNCCGN